MKVSAIPPEHVSNVWTQAAPFLEKALGTVKKRADTLDLYENCLKGDQLLWLMFDEEQDNKIVGAAITAIIEYPQYRAVAIQFMGGTEMKRWIDISMDTIARYGKDHGCETLEGYGRRAWKRWLEPRGWRQAYIAFERDLVDA